MFSPDGTLISASAAPHCGALLSGSMIHSQTFRKMDVTRERISCTLELRGILLSFQTGFNLVNVAVVCAILESISGLEPSSVITEPRHLKLVTVNTILDLST